MPVKKSNNFSFGLSFESAMARSYNIDDCNTENQVDENLVKKLKSIIDKSNIKTIIPILVSHEGRKNGPVDFIANLQDKSKIDLSIKTNNSKSDKVAPQTIGQCTKNKFFEYFSIEEECTDDEIKEFIEANIEPMILEYFFHTFESNMIYYNEIRKIFKFIKVVGDLHIDDTKISFTHIEKNKKWNESTTVKYNGTAIGEFQIHKKRNCIKFRFNLINLIKLFPRAFEVIDITLK